MIRELLKDVPFKNTTYFVCSSVEEFKKFIDLFSDEGISVINYFGVGYGLDAVNEYENNRWVFGFDKTIISITEYNGESVKMIYEKYDSGDDKRWYNEEDLNLINLTMLFRENVLDRIIQKSV